MKKNIYQHRIDLSVIKIKNAPKSEFAKAVISLNYRGYEVETLATGNKVVITKPGGKSVYGHPKKEDFLVFIFNPGTNELWQISHKQIFADIVSKSEENPAKTVVLINLLERVYHGEEPDDFINEINEIAFSSGESVETILKVYKWIWGQEDVNYPNGEGRAMSWKPIAEFRENLQ